MRGRKVAFARSLQLLRQRGGEPHPKPIYERLATVDTTRSAVNVPLYPLNAPHLNGKR